MSDMADYTNSMLTFSKPRVTNKTAHPASQYALNVRCPKCGGLMHKKHGQYGVFFGCDNFPKCNGSRGMIK